MYVVFHGAAWKHTCKYRLPTGWEFHFQISCSKDGYNWASTSCIQRSRTARVSDHNRTSCSVTSECIVNCRIAAVVLPGVAENKHKETDIPLLQVVIARFCPGGFGHGGLWLSGDCLPWECILGGIRGRLFMCLIFKRGVLCPVQPSVNCCAFMVEAVPRDLVQTWERVLTTLTNFSLCGSECFNTTREGRERAVSFS